MSLSLYVVTVTHTHTGPDHGDDSVGIVGYLTEEALAEAYVEDMNSRVINSSYTTTYGYEEVSELSV